MTARYNGVRSCGSFSFTSSGSWDRSRWSCGSSPSMIAWKNSGMGGESIW